MCEATRTAVPSDVSVGYRRAIGSGVVGEYAATRRTIHIPDARTHANFVDTLGGTRSELCVPVIHGGAVLAVINAESLRLNRFAGQYEMLETVAGQVAGMLHAAKLREELTRTYEQLRVACGKLEDAS